MKRAEVEGGIDVRCFRLSLAFPNAPTVNFLSSSASLCSIPLVLFMATVIWGHGRLRR